MRTIATRVGSRRTPAFRHTSDDRGTARPELGSGIRRQSAATRYRGAREPVGSGWRPTRRRYRDAAAPDRQGRRWSRRRVSDRPQQACDRQSSWRYLEWQRTKPIPRRPAWDRLHARGEAPLAACGRRHFMRVPGYREPTAGWQHCLSPSGTSADLRTGADYRACRRATRPPRSSGCWSHVNRWVVRDERKSHRRYLVQTTKRRNTGARFTAPRRVGLNVAESSRQMPDTRSSSDCRRAPQR